MAMHRSTLSVISAITLAVGSCLALAASIFIVLYTQIEYTIMYHYGVRVIDAQYFVRLGIAGFDLFAFVFGLIATVQFIRGKGFRGSVLAAALLLVSGLLFFVSFLVKAFLPSLFGFSVVAWWWLLWGFFGFPIVFVASLALISLVLDKRGVQPTKKSTLLHISGALMLLCSVEAFFFGFISYSPTWTYPYETALNDSGFLTPIYSWILGALTIAFASAAGALMLLRRNTQLAIVLTVFVLFLGILSSVVFTSTIYYALIWSWIGVHLFAPTIVLSSLALVSAIYSLKKEPSVHEQRTK